MLISITNNDFSEKIATLAADFHDAPISNYKIEGNIFKMTMMVSKKKTLVGIGPCDRIIQREADSEGKDWFLTFSFNKIDGRLEVDGVMNKYTLHLSPSTEFNIVRN